MDIDHIIIFSNNQGQEAEELINFGLIEGSNRIHPGQGTRNRKFYFENFFLEIVWVYNEEEVKSKLTGPTRLWERANHKLNNFSPFGICLVNTPSTDTLFINSLAYHPSYLAKDSSIDIITNNEHPYLPWVCRLPSTLKNSKEEPKKHKVNIKFLTKVKICVPQKDYQNEFTQLLSKDSIIHFQAAEMHSITLQFDRKRNNSIKKFKTIPLIIEY